MKTLVAFSREQDHSPRPLPPGVDSSPAIDSDGFNPYGSGPEPIEPREQPKDE